MRWQFTLLRLSVCRFPQTAGNLRIQMQLSTHNETPNWGSSNTSLAILLRRSSNAASACLDEDTLLLGQTWCNVLQILARSLASAERVCHFEAERQCTVGNSAR